MESSRSHLNEDSVAQVSDSGAELAPAGGESGPLPALDQTHGNGPESLPPDMTPAVSTTPAVDSLAEETLDPPAIDRVEEVSSELPQDLAGMENDDLAEIGFREELRAAGGQPPMVTAIPADVPVTIIRPTRGWRALDLREVWRYRELMLTLAWREITIRYKQTFLGATWAIIQPLMTTGIFSVLFGLLMGRGNEPSPQGIPYVVSTFCAMLPWQLFATSLNQSGNILIQYRSMITKIYFPRLILPAAAVLSTLVDFSIALVALFVVMAVYGVVPTWAVVFLPAFILMAVIAALSVGLWLAALNAIYRDFRYVIPFIVQLGMFISPVVYSTEVIRDKMSPFALTIYSLNPMVGVIEGFRWALLGAPPPPAMEFALSGAATVLILIGGMFYFRRMERLIADII